jgi:hypothetical protein
MRTGDEENRRKRKPPHLPSGVWFLNFERTMQANDSCQRRARRALISLSSGSGSCSVDTGKTRRNRLPSRFSRVVGKGFGGRQSSSERDRRLLVRPPETLLVIALQRSGQARVSSRRRGQSGDHGIRSNQSSRINPTVVMAAIAKTHKIPVPFRATGHRPLPDAFRVASVGGVGSGVQCESSSSRRMT